MTLTQKIYYGQRYSDFMNFVKSQQFKKLDVCWNYVRNIKEIDRIVIGLNNLQQLKQILNIKKDNLNEVPHFMRKEEINLINPTTWK